MPFSECSYWSRCRPSTFRSPESRDSYDTRGEDPPARIDWAEVGPRDDRLRGSLADRSVRATGGSCEKIAHAAAAKCPNRNARVLLMGAWTLEKVPFIQPALSPSAIVTKV